MDGTPIKLLGLQSLLHQNVQVRHTHNGLCVAALHSRVHNHSLCQDEGHRAAQPGHGGKDALLVGEVLPAEPEERPEDEDEEQTDRKDADVDQREAPERADEGAQLILCSQLLR